MGSIFGNSPGLDLKKMKYPRIIPILSVVLMLLTGESLAYVIPLEQILGGVQKKISGLNSLIIEQATHVIHSRDPLRETVFREKVWIKTPRYERTMEMAAPHIPNVEESVPKTRPGTGNEGLKAENHSNPVVRQPNPDTAFRWFLMANPKGGIAAFLSQLGIQIWDVGYDRCDGIVAYRVGARGPENPKFLVDKERFLPLMLCYILPGDPDGRLVTVRFKDYRKIDAGWYPYEIDYALANGPTEVYYILDLTANVPIQASFFENVERATAPPKPSGHPEKPDDQRLEEIMRALKNKYQ